MECLIEPYKNSENQSTFFIIFDDRDSHKFYEVSGSELIEVLDSYFKNGKMQWTGKLGNLIKPEIEETLLTIQSYDDNNGNIKTICTIRESGYAYISYREYKITGIHIEKLFKDVRNIAETGYLYQ